jgi:hypothetical protein
MRASTSSRAAIFDHLARCYRFHQRFTRSPLHSPAAYFPSHYDDGTFNTVATCRILQGPSLYLTYSRLCPVQKHEPVENGIQLCLQLKRSFLLCTVRYIIFLAFVGSWLLCGIVAIYISFDKHRRLIQFVPEQHKSNLTSNSDRIAD